MGIAQLMTLRCILSWPHKIHGIYACQKKILVQLFGFQWVVDISGLAQAISMKLGDAMDL